MKEICKEDLGDTGSELFGPEVRKKITERANTIDAFNKAIGKVDNPTRPSTEPSTSSSFLSKRPTAKYGGKSGRDQTPYSRYRPYKPGYRGNRATGAAFVIRRGSQKPNARPNNQGPTSRGQFAITPSCMASNYGQSMGVAVYPGVSPGVWGCFAIRQLATQMTHSYPRTVTDTGSRNSKPASKECNRRCTRHKGLLQSNVHCPPKKMGGWRPIINLKRLNSYLEVPHFKMEGISSLKDVLRMSDFMGKIDLQDAYLTVPICRQHRNFLKFHWQGRNYRFRSLPFGLATAPRVFTKILRPLAAMVRKMAIRIIIYLDDILIMAQTKELLTSHMEILAWELQELGFKLNHRKCVWKPAQVIEFLGFLINSETMTIHLPEDKVQKVMKECRLLINKKSVTARELAHLIGLLTSTIPAVSVAPLHYRALQRLRH